MLRLTVAAATAVSGWSAQPGRRRWGVYADGRAVNARGQQGDPASVSFRIAAPAAPVTIELIPGYFR
ncbi:hypothetical protein [Escherichia coli]|uniref:hypothetical protein n=1 Tax=Escherichia coli TaxID=562 RepID=UPI003B2841E9